MASPKEILSGIRLGRSRTDSRAKWIKAILEYAVSVDIGSIAADSDLTVTVTLPGVAVGDYVVVSPPASLEANVAVGQPWVSAADTVKFIVENETLSAIDPAAATWKFLVFKS